MDAHHLATLRAVRDAGGVTVAAARLHLTPSAVSQHLRALSEEAGLPLTRRSGRGIVLTGAGQALADAAADVAVAMERARTAVDEFRGAPTGLVRVAMFQSAAMLLAPGLLHRVAARDGIRVELGDRDVAQQDFPALTSEFDLVVAHRPGAGDDWPAGLRVTSLLHEPLDVALPVDHPFAGQPELSPAELVGQHWIAVEQDFPVGRVLDRLAAVAGSPPTVVQRFNDFGVLEALVAAGHGITLLPRYTTSGRPGVRLVPLAGVGAARRVDALMAPERAERRVVRLVLDDLVTEAAEASGR